MSDNWQEVLLRTAGRFVPPISPTLEQEIKDAQARILASPTLHAFPTTDDEFLVVLASGFDHYRSLVTG